MTDLKAIEKLEMDVKKAIADFESLSKEDKLKAIEKAYELKLLRNFGSAELKHKA